MASRDHPELPPGDPDRLQGWKDIAAHLGKAVRTVQRWEKEYGLPVHRLGREGEIRWASRRELEQWLREASSRLRDSGRTEEDGGSGPDDANGSQPAGTAPLPGAAVPADVPGPRSDLRRTWVAVAALAILVVGIVLGWTGAGRSSASPSATALPVTARFYGRALHVFDGAGRELWAKPFPFVEDSAYFNPRIGEQGGRIRVHDLDGDGSPEVVFAAYSATRDPGSGLFVYDRTGAERFTTRPRRAVTFGADSYAGPWLPYRVFIGPRRTDGTSSIFVVFIHTSFPSVLLELDARGRQVGEYWSNGYITWVLASERKGRPVVAVGGTHNDTRDASLAIFDAEHAIGAAPATAAKYRCVDCPPGTPAHFLIFPRRALAQAQGPEFTATVHEVQIDLANNVHLQVGEGDVNPDLTFASTVWYSLAPSLALVRIEPGAALARIHNEWFAANRVDHPFGRQDLDALQPVRRWADGRFVELPPVPVDR